MPQFADDIFLGGNSGTTYMGTASYASSSVFNGTIAATTLTVTSAASGDALVVGQYISGAGVTANTFIVSVLANNILGQAQYSLSQTSTVATAIPLFAAGNATIQNPSPISLGVGPLGRVYAWDALPQALQLANVAASQTPAAAGALALTAGISAKSFIRSDGTTVIQLDLPRAISVSLLATGTVRAYTVTGFDFYGQAMSEVITSVAAATANGKKAFYQVSSVIGAGATVVAVTVGTSDVLGLPVRTIDAGYMMSIGWAGVLARDGGTFTPADTTLVATSTTGDVRGTYQPSVPTSGVRRLVATIAVPAIAVGPNATRAGALGVNQS